MAASLDLLLWLVVLAGPVFSQYPQLSSSGYGSQSQNMGYQVMAEPAMIHMPQQQSYPPQMMMSYPPQQSSSGYPSMSTQASGYGDMMQQTSSYGQAQQSSGHGQAQQSSGYGQMQQTSGYGQPQQSQGHGQAQSSSGYGQMEQSSGYPSMQQSSGYGQMEQSSGYGQPQMQQSSGYPPMQQSSGYPPMQQSSGYGQPQQAQGHGQMQQSSGYGQMQQQSSGYGQPQMKSGYGQQQQQQPQVKIIKQKIYVPVPAKQTQQKKSKRKTLTVYKGFYISGGTQLFGKFKSLYQCQHACDTTPTCFAGDYNPWTYKCYMHSNTTACASMSPHKALWHFKKVPCALSSVGIANGLIILGAQLHYGMQIKGIDNIQTCLKNCLNAGNGVASSLALVASLHQICFGIDYDFANHKCYHHTTYSAANNPGGIICAAPQINPPINLVANPTVVHIIICPEEAK